MRVSRVESSRVYVQEVFQPVPGGDQNNSFRESPITTQEQQQQQFLAYAIVTKGLCLEAALQFARKLSYQNVCNLGYS